MLGNVLGYTAAGCLVMAMGGCAVFKGVVSEPPARKPPPAAETPREEEESGPRAETPAPVPERETGGPAVRTLMEQARDYVLEKEYSQAAAVLERALRIEPKNPVIYSQLAGVHLAQELPDEAENLARKSNSLAGNWLELQAKNWRTIAGAMRARGEEASARAAEQRADYLQSRSGQGSQADE